jgi:hypothetical protein
MVYRRNQNITSFDDLQIQIDEYIDTIDEEYISNQDNS